MEEFAEGVSYGADPYRDGVTLTPKRELQALALPSEIMRLPNLNGYLKLPGPYPVARIELEYVKRPKVAPRFVARRQAPRVPDEEQADGEDKKGAEAETDCRVTGEHKKGAEAEAENRIAGEDPKPAGNAPVPNDGTPQPGKDSHKADADEETCATSDRENDAAKADETAPEGKSTQGLIPI